MNWTKETPTKSGFYWLQRKHRSSLSMELVKVEERLDTDCVIFASGKN
jgi:hypothetical protein